MAAIELIDIFVDAFNSSFGNKLAVAGVLTIFILVVLLLAQQMKILWAALFAASPFIIAALSLNLDIQWTLGIFIILIGFLFAVTYSQLFMKK